MENHDDDCAPTSKRSADPAAALGPAHSRNNNGANTGRNRASKRTKAEQQQGAAKSTPNAATKPQPQRSQQSAQGGRPAGAGKTHSVTKRPTAKLSQRPNDIYVSNKSDFRVRFVSYRPSYLYKVIKKHDAPTFSTQAQLKQCNTLLSTSEFHEVFLHSIGNAITRAINLALTLVADSHGGLSYEANTSTIELTDNLHPLHDDADFAVNRRLNGCLHIRVFRHCRDVLIAAEETTADDKEGAVGTQH